jgi:NADH:ubiquinone oxidoreductase subunit 3 (subunit A)
MNKKSNVIDIIVIIIVLFLFGFISVFGLKIFTDLNTDLQADFTHDAGKDVSDNLFSTYPSLMDNLFLMAFILFIIFAVISVFLLDTHPIFFVIVMITLIGIFAASILLGNVFSEVMRDPSLFTYANQLTFTSWIMNNVLQLSIGLGFLMTIGLFIKMR